MIENFPRKDLLDNVVKYESGMFGYFKEYLPNIKKGMSYSQLIHDIYKNKKLDEEFSKVLDATSVTGYITISIDPIDYMLMSLNNSGWTSCHTLHHPEEPRKKLGWLFSRNIQLHV